MEAKMSSKSKHLFQLTYIGHFNKYNHNARYNFKGVVLETNVKCYENTKKGMINSDLEERGEKKSTSTLVGVALEPEGRSDKEQEDLLSSWSPVSGNRQAFWCSWHSQGTKGSSDTARNVPYFLDHKTHPSFRGGQ